MASSQMKRNWSDLPADPLRKIADYLLEKEEYVDTYAACQEVCTDWRCTLKVPEFHLNNWIMIDHTLQDVGDFTFLNLATGRCFRTNLMDFHRRFYFVCVSRGVIVLAQRVEPYQIRLLNPITHKSNTEFQAHILSELLQSVIVTKSPTMVFVCTDYPDHIAWADESTPMGQISESFGERLYSPPPAMLLDCMMAFRGEVYALLENGDILSTNIKLEQHASTVAMAKIILALVFEQVRGTYKFYLVESDGDLLLVLNGDFAKGQPVLYQVDTENHALEAIGDIGSHALFVDYNQSISIGTRLHPTVKPGCIYYRNYIRLYDREVQAWEEEPTMKYGLSLEH